jgi:hypothetical protein
VLALPDGLSSLSVANWPSVGNRYWPSPGKSCWPPTGSGMRDNRDRHLVLQGCYLGWEPLTGFLCRGAGAEVALLPKSSDLAHEVTWLGGVA